MRVKLLAPVVLGVFIAAACGGNKATSKVDDGAGSAGSSNGTAGSGNGSGTAGANNGSGGSIIIVGSGGSSASGNEAGDGSFDPDAACATSSAAGQPVPVDLFFMIDTTGSMNCVVPDDPDTVCDGWAPPQPIPPVNRWSTESAALKAFISDPNNAGLGVGIEFFPGVNQSSNSVLCDPASYTTPTVEIATLPGAAKNLDDSIDMQAPGGNTPTEPSIEGALKHATAWAKAHPTHRVAVIYSTDGYPKGCDSNNTIAAAAQKAAAAFAATPSIPTYVLGVGPNNLDDLNSIASSGGTDKAFLIDTTQDAATQLSTALAKIRTTAVVGCTYVIPPPPQGQTLDPDKVNVTYTDGKGKVTQVLQDPAGTTCAKGSGWEYSADGKQINLCGSLCDTVKADTGGSLQVLFGCATEVGQPPR